MIQQRELDSLKVRAASCMTPIAMPNPFREGDVVMSKAGTRMGVITRVSAAKYSTYNWAALDNGITVYGADVGRDFVLEPAKPDFVVGQRVFARNIESDRVQYIGAIVEVAPSSHPTSSGSWLAWTDNKRCWLSRELKSKSITIGKRFHPTV